MLRVRSEQSSVLLRRAMGSLYGRTKKRNGNARLGGRKGEIWIGAVAGVTGVRLNMTTRWKAFGHVTIGVDDIYTTLLMRLKQQADGGGA